MAADAPEPLWREVVGDTEPWRRGRNFLIGIAVLQLLVHVASVAVEALGGDIERIVRTGAGATVFWLCFFLVWVGIHWVRLVWAGLGCVLGLAKLIWGIRDGNLVHLIDATISLPLAAYLGFAPAVYHFAVRQRERLRWPEVAAFGAVFVLLLGSFGAAVFGVTAYRVQQEHGARAFAEQAFRRVFVERDAEYLRQRATERVLYQEGWERLKWFVQQLQYEVGTVQEVGPPQGRVRCFLKMPGVLVTEATLIAYAKSSSAGAIRLHMRCGNAGAGWQIDSMSWRYADVAPAPQP
jgi:hypothetical protein